MLYEVITGDPQLFKQADTSNYTPDSVVPVSKHSDISKYFMDYSLEEDPRNFYFFFSQENRITSYNVCYTKLLRRGAAPAPCDPRDQRTDVVAVCRNRNRLDELVATARRMRQEDITEVV